MLDFPLFTPCSGNLSMRSSDWKYNLVSCLYFHFSEELTSDEKDQISGFIGNRCPELRKALGVHEGRLEPVHSQTNFRERARKIINIWEQNNDDVTIRKFVDGMNKMNPLPHDVIDVCLTV